MLCLSDAVKLSRVALGPHFVTSSRAAICRLTDESVAF